MRYIELSKEELNVELDLEYAKYSDYKKEKFNLNMSRGIPGPEQLDICMPMLNEVGEGYNYKTEDGIDTRNYGVLDGIPEIKRIFGEILDLDPENVIVGGNSSLNIMYDTIMRMYVFGASESSVPLGKQGKIKFLCPVPGYDRHFSICQQFGIEMINIPMNNEGPDMDMIEALVGDDETIKGIWCVPKYSNPNGITYSDATVKRFASLKPKANDFRIFWDNAYAIHDLYPDRSDSLLNIFPEAEKYGNEDMIFIFASTSKITFPGAGIAAIACSTNNIVYLKKLLSMQTIGPNKINQLMHAHFLKDISNINVLMQRIAEINRPKFNVVSETLSAELGDKGVASWSNPNGGFFFSLDVMDNCAKKIILMSNEIGLSVTPGGSTYPYMNDPLDSNIRIAPTFPSVDELQKAMDILCICIKIVCIEKILENMQIYTKR
jgi:aspartate/methionine/tyrosine aminotransferase